MNNTEKGVMLSALLYLYLYLNRLFIDIEDNRPVSSHNWCLSETIRTSSKPVFLVFLVVLTLHIVINKPYLFVILFVTGIAFLSSFSDGANDVLTEDEFEKAVYDGDNQLRNKVQRHRWYSVLGSICLLMSCFVGKGNSISLKNATPAVWVSAVAALLGMILGIGYVSFWFKRNSVLRSKTKKWTNGVFPRCSFKQSSIHTFNLIGVFELIALASLGTHLILSSRTP